MEAITIEQVKKQSWKNQVISHVEFLKEFNKYDNTLTSLKSIVKMMIEKEEKSIIEKNIRNSNQFKDELINKLY